MGERKGPERIATGPYKLTNEYADLSPVLLDTGGSEAGQSVAVDRALPAQIFLYGQGVPVTGFLEAQQAAANCCDYFGFTADDPALGSRRWKVRNGQRTAIGPDDIVHPWTQLTVNLHNSTVLILTSVRVCGCT